MSIEVFFAGDDVKEQFGSRLRISAGLAYIVDSRWSADINLINQESRDTGSGDVRHRRPTLAQ